MTNSPFAPTLDAIYASIKNGNQDLDALIITLKTAMYAQGAKSVEMNPSKLAQSNRQGRKLLQSYFKKRGVVVTFAEGQA